MKHRIVVTMLAVCGIAGFGPGAGHKEAHLPPNQAEFRNEHVCIALDIESNIYTYKVSNLSSSPIVGFTVTQHAAYNFKTPDGWQMDTSGKLFRTWTEIPTNGIAPGKTGEFSLRVSSEGAVLGRAPATLELQSGRTIELMDVWSPVPEPRSYIALMAGIMFLIVLLHSALIILRNRRVRKSSVTV